MKAAWFVILLSLGRANCNYQYVDMLDDEMFTASDLNTICQYFQNVVNVSEKCAQQLEVVCENSTLLMTMLDASSKFPYTGLGYASKLNYGNYDQCLTISHHYEGGRILGKHCTVGLIIPNIFHISDINTFFKLSVCKPDACFASDFNAILKSITNIDSLTLFQDGMCQTVESNKDFTAADIVTLTIFAIIMSLMVASTLYDICVYQRNPKNGQPLFISFSVLSNGRKLLHISAHSKSKEVIETFHGIRVISMMWIVAGHGFIPWQGIAVTNTQTVEDWQNQGYSGYIVSSYLAVDTFFFMSGFLLAFQYIKNKKKSVISQITSVPYSYIHRYLRLTPAMLMVFLVMISVFKHLGDGPLWSNYDVEAKNCRDNWWAFFLYIQNYHNYNNVCLIQTWYLSADMQMFLLSPLILIPVAATLRRSSGFKISMVELLTINVIFTFLPMVVKLRVKDYTNEYDTHSRIINYMVGITLGVFMGEKIDTPFLHIIGRCNKSVINFAIWIVVLLGMLVIVICYQIVTLNHSYESQSIFSSLMRPAWCIGLSWITYSCYHGYGGIVNWILCRPIYQILGRLNYCIYLVHGLVVMYYVLTTRTLWYFSDYNAFYLFCGHYVMSIVIAFFWSLAFESPFINIEKCLTGRGRRTKTDQNKENVTETEETKNRNVESSSKNEDLNSQAQTLPAKVV